jgi:hypothetical protein
MDAGQEQNQAPTTQELTEYGIAASTGLGILTMALAPLAIPFLVLTAVFALPLLLPVIALGLVGAIVAIPVLLIRRLTRRRSQAGVRQPTGGPVPTG